MSYWIMVGITALITTAAQWLVKSRYNKYSKIANSSLLTGEAAARLRLERKGIGDVGVSCGKGELTDYYDPAKREIVLSPAVFNGTSISSLAVAAHETGHAVQHAEADAFFKFRSALVPMAKVCEGSFMWVLLAGIFLHMTGLIDVAIVIFSGVVLFHLATLPVEFNASERARVLLYDNGLLNSSDDRGLKAVLGSAALTYVAGTAASLMYLLYLIGNRR